MNFYLEKMFFIMAIACIYSINIFSENIDYKTQYHVLTKSYEIETTTTKDIQETTTIWQYNIKGQNSEWPTRSLRRSVMASRIILIFQKPPYFAVPIMVYAREKALPLIDYVAHTIKLNNCSSIIHLFYLY